MSEGGHPPRSRDADRSRAAILDAAETLFAERGFEETSLQAVGEAAGVSRGTPGYFFGTKDHLYRAVLERLFADEFAFVTAAQAVAAEGDAGAALVATLDGLLDFLAARPAFVRLIDREAAAGAPVLRDLPAFAEAVRAGRAMTAALIDHPAFRRVDPDQFLLDALALCWFPFAHAATFATAMGLDPAAPEFVAARKRHVAGLLLRSLVIEPASR